MKSSFRYLIMLAIAAALGLTIYLVGKAEPEQKALFLGVDGDPRMRLCDSPVNGELADPAVLKAMGIDSPFAKGGGLPRVGSAPCRPGKHQYYFFHTRS
jgi:hypothetical protein